MLIKSCICCLCIVILKCVPTHSIFIVIPQDVPAALAAIYGFAPPFLKGSDNRLGFGFRFGNHADFQVLYEFGPQTVTRPLTPAAKIRSVSVRQRYVRRRPVLEFFLRAGILKDSSYRFNVLDDDYDDEPR